jgi:DNA polymerase IIIc chi subunit
MLQELLWGLTATALVPHATHSSDGTTAVGHLQIATESYGPWVQRHIIVVTYYGTYVL